jgi:hypothetical protein
VPIGDIAPRFLPRQRAGTYVPVEEPPGIKSRHRQHFAIRELPARAATRKVEGDQAYAAADACDR